MSHSFKKTGAQSAMNFYQTSYNFLSCLVSLHFLLFLASFPL